MDLSAVGVPVMTGPGQGWNFWPIVGIPIALLVAYRWLRLPRTVVVAIGAILAGLLTADAISAWGVLPVLGAGACLTIGAAVAVRRARRGHPPTV